MSDTDKSGGEIAIDYLSKDWDSLRRLMLERIGSVAPEAVTGNAADPGTVLVELLAYAADQVSHYQDAVATEAYLGTARLRTSVRRHARLLDYAVHDGANARAFIAIVVGDSADGKVLPAGTSVWTRVDGQPAILTAGDVPGLRARGALGFETMHAVLLRKAHNRIAVAPLASDDPLLAIGATSVTLRDDGQALALAVGDVLVLEARPPSASGAGGAGDAGGSAQPVRTVAGDPQRRHAVRLTAVTSGVDARTGLPVVTVGWSSEDALPFALRRDRAQAIGNVVLADHGYTLPAAERIDTAGCRGDTASPRRARPLLAQGPLTFRSLVVASGQALPFDPTASASAAFPDAGGALVEPAIWLSDDQGRPWSARRDLLASSAYARDFVVETEDDGRAYLRFGDGVYGARPESDLSARYRIGGGKAGNVGAEALYHIVSEVPGLLFARNPLPARGGVDPESLDHVRLHAPRQFHRQERAVTVEDYAAIARAFPSVLDALVERRFTGTYTTLVLTVLRRDGAAADEEFAGRLRAFLDRFRMIGHEVAIRDAVRVPLDIQLGIEVETGHSRPAVLAAVAAALGIGRGTTPTPGTGKQRTGAFHQERLRLGQPVYLSQLVTAAMQIPGVRAATALRFGRYGRRSSLDSGVLEMRAQEVGIVENVANQPERGRIDVVLQGGSNT